MSRPEPLPARSVLLSVLLGSHPPELPVRTLVRTAGLFGIAEGTARVALSRLSADGEVVATAGIYRLSRRHLDRQRDQDRAHRPETRPWRGGWDIVAPTRPADTELLARRRLAELHPGIWVRPDNLVQDGLGPGPWVAWNGRLDGDQDPVDLVARLWDLPAWSKTAGALLDELSTSSEPADRLRVAAAMVRHIRSDPMLPPILLPAGWPGDRLRRNYDSFRAELGRWITDQRDG
ncbi:MAG TPA: hypothetical protein VG435_16070 [Acidimicrobiales bacterium]|nr:hypothetical protein [Acidimicrobiales bacterium]